jgi:hypothetical protein
MAAYFSTNRSVSSGAGRISQERIGQPGTLLFEALQLDESALAIMLVLPAQVHRIAGWRGTSRHFSERFLT